ncbi:MAG: S8 family serine peptidase [Chitinispirillaceae bacterium]|nr:S8 family serine peptidase [Chitinispirillaceae bacterium]
MNYRRSVIFIILVLLVMTPARGDPSADSGAARTVQSASVMKPTIIRAYGTDRSLRPHASLLDDNGFYYRYQGKPIPLLRMKDRIALASRENGPPPTSALKKSTRFKDVRLRQIRRGKKPMAIMTFDQATVDEVRKKGYDATVGALRGELEKDPSIAAAMPVYYEPASGKEVILTDRVAVKFTAGADETVRNAVASLLDATPERQSMPSVYILRCNNLKENNTLMRCRLLEGVAGVEWAEPEMLSRVEKNFTPNDPLFGSQWHLNNTGWNGADSGAHMDVAAAWDIQRMGDSAISIAVIDDGVDTGHADLAIKSGGWDFHDNDDDPTPSDSVDMHGTAVAGVAAAIGNNGIGVAGVAAGSKILPIKISEGRDFASYLVIGNAITWAYEHGADVLNASWHTGLSDYIATAIGNASTLGRGGKGCPVFCSSGNAASTFTGTYIRFSGAAQRYVAFVYKKNGSIDSADDRVAIDNVALYGSDGDSVLFTETFSGGTLPAGWSTSGGNNPATPDQSVPGWFPTTTIYNGGFGDAAAFQSGDISADQWTELRMPLMTFSAGQRLSFEYSLSTEEDNDSFTVRFYSSIGSLVDEVYVGSGIDTSNSAIVFPASSDSAIAVGASTDQDFRSGYSQYDVAGTGKTVDFLAPSGGGWNGIATTDLTGADGYSDDDYYPHFSGTSSACPAASGVAALILSRNPHLSRNKVLEVMRSSCEKIGGVTYTNSKNNEYGYGRLNAHIALQNLPPVIIGQDSVGVMRNGSVTLTVDLLDIVDTETPGGPFTLAVSGGSSYSVNGTTVTPAANFVGTLSVPVSVNDGTFSSDRYILSVTIRAANNAPVINRQNPISMLEDEKRPILNSDLDITDSDDSGPFLISISAGTNYTVVGDTVVPDPDYNGSLFIPVTASDGFTSSAAFTVTITVTPVNDTPSFVAGGNVTVDEDQGPQTVVSWAKSISAGPNESGQTLSFVLTTAQTSLFSVLPAIAENGDLTYTTASNASGIATINVRLHDDGGTDDGGIDSSAEAGFTITVFAVNDAPTFSPGAAVSILEDAGPQTLQGWASITAGAPDESGQSVSVSVTVTDESLFSGKPAFDLDGTLKFTPAANRYGTSSVTAVLTDDGGTSGGGVATYTAAPFTITVDPVNDAPVFTAGQNVSVYEDAGPQALVNWAAGISAGDNENGQSLSFSAETTDSALFSSPPALDSQGTLTFTPAPDANGSAAVTVRLNDDGGTADGGIDSSAEAGFTITVIAVNDLPRIAVSGNLDIVLGGVSVITVSATDIDGTIPDIRVESLPSFATFSSTSGSGIATITCSPQTDTGTFSVTIIADDNLIPVDSVISIRVRELSVGAIEIAGAPPSASVALYATAGWIGTPARTGAGKIDSVPAGPCLVSVADSAFRTEYYFCTVKPDAVDTVTVSQRPRVAVGFSANDSLKTEASALIAGSLVSVVEDDLDNDGANDIVYAGDDGVVRFCKRSGSAFEPPVAVLSADGGRTTLRCVDWNGDGVTDILTVNSDGTVSINFGDGGLSFGRDSILFSTDAGCTGIDLVPHGDNGKAGYYIGYSDGTVNHVFTAPGGSLTTLPVRLADGQLLDVGDDAAVAALDVTGDGRNELLIGNGAGNVETFTLTATDTVRSLGKCTAGGKPLSGSGGLSLSSSFGSAGDLPKLVYSDGTGALFYSNGIVRGDITADGIVDVLDLQQLGIHWGQRESDSGWSGAANLQVGATGSDPQVINVLDLQVLGNFWGTKK